MPYIVRQRRYAQFQVGGYTRLRVAPISNEGPPRSGPDQDITVPGPAEAYQVGVLINDEDYARLREADHTVVDMAQLPPFMTPQELEAMEAKLDANEEERRNYPTLWEHLDA